MMSVLKITSFYVQIVDTWANMYHREKYELYYISNLIGTNHRFYLHEYI